MVMRGSDQAKLDSAQLAQLQAMASAFARKGTRKQSEHVFLGLALYSIARGPDLSQGELFGHAKGVLAIGDRATGIIAIGPIALGLVSLGAVSLGLLLALGGVAVGTVAIGATALGVVAIGAAAEGYYAAGAATHGAYVIDTMRRSPEAIEFFSQWGILDLFGRIAGLWH